MPRVIFEPTTPEFERAKKVRTLDCAVTVIGLIYIVHHDFIEHLTALI
jgi:hypothetical protein